MFFFLHNLVELPFFTSFIKVRTIHFPIQYNSTAFVMKTFIFIIFLTFRQLASCQNIMNSKSISYHSTKAILLEHFAKSSPSIELICIGVKRRESEKLMEKFLRNTSESIVVTVIRFDDNSSWDLRLNKSSVLIFDSHGDFKTKSANISWQTNPTDPYYHLVLAPNLTMSDVKSLQGFSIDKVGFLVDMSEKSIDLATSFMYAPGSCRKNHFVKINRFKRSTMRWENSIFYPEKYRNFHGCNLTIAKSFYLGKGGASLNAIAVFGEILNFKSRIKNFIDIEDSFDSTEVDLIADTIINPDTSRVVIGQPYEIMQHMFFIPPGVPYTAFEKMLLPFEFDVWVAILATLLLALGVILLTQLLSTSVKNFVFGLNIRTPTLNLFNILLTGGQAKVPGRNFARFLFMLFIIWCIIIRTCYQSEMFKYLQADARKPEVKSLVELIEKNFTFHVDYFIMDLIYYIAEEHGLPRYKFSI